MLTWNSHPNMDTVSSTNYKPTTGTFINYLTKSSIPSFWDDIPITYETSNEGTDSIGLRGSYFDKWTGSDVVKEYNGKILPLNDVNLNMNFHKSEKSIKAELLQKFLDVWIPYKREKGQSVDDILDELELIVDIFK